MYVLVRRLREEAVTSAIHSLVTSYFHQPFLACVGKSVRKEQGNKNEIRAPRRFQD